MSEKLADATNIQLALRRGRAHRLRQPACRCALQWRPHVVDSRQKLCPGFVSDADLPVRILPCLSVERSPAHRREADRGKNKIKIQPTVLFDYSSDVQSGAGRAALAAVIDANETHSTGRPQRLPERGVGGRRHLSWVVD
jgi:hypothetical protein